jgi:hypothetical protein
MNSLRRENDTFLIRQKTIQFELVGSPDWTHGIRRPGTERIQVECGFSSEACFPRDHLGGR